ncbi:MAG: hypothetical protein ABIP75_03390 [Pyrinomonadaceae bacterium]
MSEYKDKLDEWQKTARRKARELDEKYGLSDAVGDGARIAQDAAKVATGAAQEAAKRGAETFSGVRTEAERLDQEFEVTDRARKAAGEAARRAREVSVNMVDAAGNASERADQVFEAAKDYYQKASKFYETSAGITRASAAIADGVVKAGSWVKENPGKAALVSFSLVLGVRLGTSFPGLDAVLLGSHPHWFTHSALPVYGLRKASEKFDEYLKGQEKLAQNGELAQAERERAEFERKIVKYVGAPLLGAFSCAAGGVMMAQIFQPGRITGAPISWLLGGNPVLDGVWLFANGVICFHQGYKFFMMALADEEQVQKVVREIKGLLPA